MNEKFKFFGGRDKLNIAFGSCYGLDGRSSDIFKVIQNGKPDLFIWMGDVAYTDDVYSQMLGISDGILSIEHINKSI